MHRGDLVPRLGLGHSQGQGEFRILKRLFGDGKNGLHRAGEVIGREIGETENSSRVGSIRSLGQSFREQANRFRRLTGKIRRESQIALQPWNLRSPLRSFAVMGESILI